jgi:hypothetical protein
LEDEMYLGTSKGIIANVVKVETYISLEDIDTIKPYDWFDTEFSPYYSLVKGNYWFKVKAADIAPYLFPSPEHRRIYVHPL